MNLETSFMAMQPQPRFLPDADPLAESADASMAAGLLALDAFVADGNSAALHTAAHCFAQALMAGDHRTAEACRCLAFVYTSFEQHDIAIEYLQQAAALEPDAPGLNALKRLVYTARLLEPDAPFAPYPFN